MISWCLLPIQVCLVFTEGQGYPIFSSRTQAIALARWRGIEQLKLFPLMVIKWDMVPKVMYRVGKSFLFLFDLRPHGLCSPWNSPGQNTGVGSLSLLQGIFPQESNQGLLHCRKILYQLSYEGSLDYKVTQFLSGTGKQMTKAIISAMKEREGPIALHTFSKWLSLCSGWQEVNPSDCQKALQGVGKGAEIFF